MSRATDFQSLLVRNAFSDLPQPVPLPVGALRVTNATAGAEGTCVLAVLG